MQTARARQVSEKHQRAEGRRMSNGVLVLATSTTIIRPREFFQFNILSNDKARTKVRGMEEVLWVRGEE